MKVNRLLALALMMTLSAVLFVWNHTQAKAHKTGSVSRTDLVRDENITLAGIVFPVITTPLPSRLQNLAVPLNTWVKRGQVIGITESDGDPEERDRAWREVEEARNSERTAQEEIRQDEEELSTLQSQAGRMEREEALAEVAESEAQGEFERQENLFRSGLTSGFDHNAAATARASAGAAIDSIRSNLAESAIQIDQWEAKTQQAEVELREATSRRNAAEAVFEQMQGGPVDEPVASPVDGMIIASGESVGIASDPGQVGVNVMVRHADLIGVRVGQQAEIVLDAHPAVTLAGKVTTISENPADSSDGGVYEVVCVADNPGGTWLAGEAVHVHLLRDLPH